MSEVYCILNAPHEHGSLWVEFDGATVKVMNPAGAWWRDKEFTKDEFLEIIKGADIGLAREISFEEFVK
jgi:hypothetical protein